MKFVELYTERARVWLPDVENVWRGAALLRSYKDGDLELKVVLELQEGDDAGEEEKVISLGKDASKPNLPHLRNPDILLGENDLTSLSYLHEPAVLYNLQIRFVERNAIYTYCGIVLVAINPYESLDIYSDDYIQLYSGRNLGEMDPHIFAIAEEAFKQMSREERNQSIIVTGESGAGKTVSAKYTMRYFACVGGSGSESTVEQKVLASNPIMEAIGNAKTIRNDNSSRFGKYIQISFNQRYAITGANMRTYLLEKSRVVSQAPDERNYHVFYQLCACAGLPQFQPLKLMSADKFEYTRIGNCIEIDGVDDRKEFTETVHALTLLGVSSKYQSLMFRVLSAILHMGNIDIMQGNRGNDSCQIKGDDYHLLTMCELLGIEAKQMAQWMCHKKITAMAEVVVTPLHHDQAMSARDALAKHMYSKLFEWIVNKVNQALISNTKEHSFIGVLDIYGFETFQVNSFEQFCINYANEKLQQQFCQHVFKLEQEEYVREEIEWKFIDFYDNQPCIDLIERKLGILDLLNDECRLGTRGSDQSWVNKLYDRHLKTSKHFSKSKISNTSFFVVHFADTVRYEMEGFLDKNRDTVNEEPLAILKASQYELVAELFVEPDKDKSVEVNAGIGRQGARTAKMTLSHSTSKPMGGGQMSNRKKETRKTVASQFQESLTHLMTTLNSTTPHYVRCIKPNDYKMPFTFEPKRATQQLRACGVLETIRISSAGYPSRWTYGEFFGRYRVLMRSAEISKGNYRKTCEAVLARLIPEPDKYQPGKTKIFFRAGQVAYLEKLRADKLRACAIMIQKHLRGWLQQRKYQRKRHAALTLQRYARGRRARCLVTMMRRTRAATRVQARWRGWVCRRAYLRTLAAIQLIQSYARGMLARTVYRRMLRHAKSIVIQKHVRGWLARLHFRHQLKSIVLIQCCVRRLIAKRQLKVLKIEARSVDHFKKLNRGMENKIMELQRKLDQSTRENTQMAARAAEAVELRRQLAAAAESRDLVEKLKTRIAELETEVAAVNDVLRDEKAERKIALEAFEKERADKDEVMTSLTHERDELIATNRRQSTENSEREAQLKQEYEGVMTSRCSVLEEELEQVRSQNQNHIKEFNRLEQRYDNIKDELEMLRNKQEEEEFLQEMKREEDAERREEDFAQRAEDPAQTNGNLTRKVKDEEEEEGHSALKRQLQALEDEKSKLEQDVIHKLQRQESFATNLKLKEANEENEKLKVEMTNLRRSIAEQASKGLTKDSDVFRTLYEQMEAMQEELEVRRAEVIELKSIQSVATPTRVQQDCASKYTMTDAELLGGRNRMEDINVEKLDKSDLKHVLATMYDHNRILELELESERRDREIEAEQFRESSHFVKKNGSFDVVSSLEVNYEHELYRLSEENNQLLAQLESQEKTIKKLKRQLKLYSKRLNESSTSAAAGGEMTANGGGDDDTSSVIGHPVLRHKDSGVGASLGMLQYKSGDESKIVRALVYDFKPHGVEVTRQPGLSAYLLFKLLRFADHSNDDKMIKTLLQRIISAIKEVEKKHDSDLEYTSFWLANTCRFLHNMRQYSGDEKYRDCCSEAQFRHCLHNFDLSEYQPVFHDISSSIFQRLLNNTEKDLKPMIVPAMLENETIQGISSSKPMRGRSSSRNSHDGATEFTVDSILKLLGQLHGTMMRHGVDPGVIEQVYKQLFYFITAHALNNQLNRKEMCNWSKAMQMRFNVTQLEEWLRGIGMKNVSDTLEPLVHASHLLQMGKRDEKDAEEICNMCTALNPAQIVKMLQMVTPTNDYEERVPVKFVKLVQSKLKEKRDRSAHQEKLLLDTSHRFGVAFPFQPSDVNLEHVALPDTSLKFITPL